MEIGGTGRMAGADEERDMFGGFGLVFREKEGEACMRGESRDVGDRGDRAECPSGRIGGPQNQSSKVSANAIEKSLN